MKFIDLTLQTPQQNLALDEALLDWSEEESGIEILRFWESPTYFVVMGYSGKTEYEVYLDSCRKSNFPVLRRPSGGGTVLQGPGCLNFSLILKITSDEPLKNLVQTNDHIMKRHLSALRPFLGADASVQGISDLTYKGLKFSGNAQRRKKKFLLFHGTFLHQFDISKISQFLPLPPLKPAYRKNRPHEHFLVNIPLKPSRIKTALQETWHAADPLTTSLPARRVEVLVQEKYSNEAWNFKF